MFWEDTILPTAARAFVLTCVALIFCVKSDDRALLAQWDPPEHLRHSPFNAM